MPKEIFFEGQPRNPKIDTTIADLNDYFEVNEQNIMSNILIGLFDPTNPYYVGNYATLMDRVNKNQLLFAITSDEVIQPMDSESFNAKGEVKLHGAKLEPEMWKVDFLLNYTKIFNKYVSALSLQKNGLIPGNENTFLLHDMFLQELKKRINADLRRTIWKGKKKANGTDAVDIFDGFIEKFKAASSAGILTPKSLGAITPGTSLAKIQELVNMLGSDYKRRNDTIVLAATDQYAKLTELATEKSVAFAGFAMQNINNGTATVPHFILPAMSNVRIYEEPNLPNGGLIATVKENLVIAMDTYDTGNLMAHKAPSLREIAITAEGMTCVGVRQFNALNGKVDETAFVCNDAVVV